MANRRWAIWIPMLAVSVGASIWVSGDAGSGTATVQPVSRATTSQTAPRAASSSKSETTTLASLAPRGDARAFDGVFSVPPAIAVRQVAKAPAPPEIPAPPPLPPLPFKFMGRLEQDGQPALFLTWGERNLVLRAGDVAEGTYRLQAITDAGADFVYLPAGQHQTLNIGAK